MRCFFVIIGLFNFSFTQLSQAILKKKKRIIAGKKFIFILLIILYSLNSYPYFESRDLFYLDDVFKGASLVSSSILSDSFNPPVHYKSGDLNISLSPTYFEVQHLVDLNLSYADGKNLSGYSFGISADYALNNRFALYFNYLYFHMDGGITGNHKGVVSPWLPHFSQQNDIFQFPYEINGFVDFQFVQYGIAYDIIHGKTWSIPVYAGLMNEYYELDMKFKPKAGNITDPYMDLNSKGSNFLKTFGLAVSCKPVEFLQITPFFLVTISGADRTLDATVTKDAQNAPYSVVGKKFTSKNAGWTLALMGIKFSYFFHDLPLGISISTTGILSNFSDAYTKFVFEGLSMKSVTLTVTYKFDNNTKSADNN